MSRIGQEDEQGFRWFIAVVEDVKSDEKQLGRVKIRLLNQHDFDEVETDELLYAQILVQPTAASYRGVGHSPTGLKVGTRVIGFFLDGNRKQQPLILGTTHHISQNKEDNHDVHPLARGKNTIKKEPVGDKVKEPDAAYAAEYYDNETYTTEQGHVIEVDDTKGEERLHVYHKSGTYIEINKDGRTVIKSMDDSYDINVKDKKIHVSGDLTIEVKGDVKQYITKNVTTEIKEDWIVSCNNAMLSANNLFQISGNPVIADG